MFEDVVNGLASYLGTTAAGAELLLSVFILVAVGLSVSMARVNIIATTVLMIATMGLLTAIGWLPLWISALAILAVCGLFAAFFARGETNSG